MIPKQFLLIQLALLLTFPVFSQKNYDESKVREYTLPELLITTGGEKISTVEAWENVRRPEILELFKVNMYGRIPGELNIDSWELLETDDKAFNGKAIRKQVMLHFTGNKKQLDVLLLIYLPKTDEKVPLFLNYNFSGNHTVAADDKIILTKSWVRNSPELGVTDHKVNEESRGLKADRYQVEKIIDSGYGFATMYYGDVDPDVFADGQENFSDGVHPLLYKEGQVKPLPDEWGAISAWAWGNSKAMDYFELDDDIDEAKIIVIGHSRLGKTALWTGAMDQRFAITISNNSGCGGAALSRRNYGEQLNGMSDHFRAWLCDNNSKYDDNVDALPLDQHMLIALMAPRPVYIASAEEDRWADPKGEFLSAYYASEVYRLYGLKAIESDQMPAVNEPIMTSIGYHIRSGKHQVTEFDWEQYIKFADMHLKGN